MKSLFFIIVFIFVGSQNTARSRSKRIINSGGDQKSTSPWFVILKKAKTQGLHCGGTIIDKSWVLTAAHCVYGLQSIFLEFGIKIFDEYNVSMTAKEFVIHPHFNYTFLFNDVALIKLPTPLNFSNQISLINLPAPKDQYKSLEGAHAVFYGYGTTDDLKPSDFSTHLKRGSVIVIRNQQCKTELDRSTVIESTLCAKGLNGSNTSICLGDSGGPLITNDSQGRTIQIGINSFVKVDNCMSGYPSAYARITSYLEFIQKSIGSKEVSESTDLQTYLISITVVISNILFLVLYGLIAKHIRLNKRVQIGLTIFVAIGFLFYSIAVLKLLQNFGSRILKSRIWKAEF
ncbi:collagenase-like [Episyrphus balteatus]|uniref:collagenase-like n=1 Tax=Episyrphus balteatus TaxID=286459 RepID=UPI00248598A0|nr:collagenase-like [Episyrphus balteatus]